MISGLYGSNKNKSSNIIKDITILCNYFNNKNNINIVNDINKKLGTLKKTRKFMKKDE